MIKNNDLGCFRYALLRPVACDNCSGRLYALIGWWLTVGGLAPTPPPCPTHTLPLQAHRIPVAELAALGLLCSHNLACQLVNASRQLHTA
jgi:hypothetical protein